MAQPLPTLIKDISLTLTVAGAVVVFSQWIGIPLVVAYLFSGMLVGPSVSFFPTIIDTSQIRVLSELGILFLLFGLGLEFSFRKLFKLGVGVLIIGVIEVVGAVFLGYHVAVWLGLEGVQRIVFGFITAISSTGVIIKLLQEKRLLKQSFAQVVIGVLIVEDLFAIIFLLLLSILKHPSLAAISAEIGLLFSVSTIWLVGGTIVVPLIVKKITPYLTDEVLLISSLGFCLGIVLVANELGISSALAAFLCGSVLAETDQQHRIEEITRPVRQFFAAIFFVCMGMLVHPWLILSRWKEVLIVVTAVMVVKFFLNFLASLMTGRSVHDSSRIGLLMSQIGEFSIIIASLSVIKGILPAHVEGVVVGASAILILITGILSKFEEKIARGITSNLPRKVSNAIERYRYVISHFERGDTLNKADKKRRRMKLLQNVIVICAIFFVAKFIIVTKLTNPFEELAVFSIATFLSVPFLFSMSGISDGPLLRKQRPIQDSIIRRLSAGHIVRLLLTNMFYMMVAFVVLPDLRTLFFVVLVGTSISYFFSKQMYTAKSWVFARLANEDKTLQLEDALPAGGPWDEHLIALTVHPFAEIVDKTLAELDLRNKYQVNVIFHQRADRRTVAPAADTKLYPADVVLLMGNNNSLEQVESMFNGKSTQQERDEDIQQKFIVEQVRIEPGSVWDGKALLELDLQHSLRAVIVAIEREGQQIKSLQGSTTIQAGDLLWLAMDRSRLEFLDSFTASPSS